MLSLEANVSLLVVWSEAAHVPPRQNMEEHRVIIMAEAEA